MDSKTLVLAYKPHVSFKDDPQIRNMRGSTHSYRGYKGVGLTFLAYGTNHIRLHSRKGGPLTKTRMEYGRAWVDGTRSEAAKVDLDPDNSPLDKLERGTFVKVYFSPQTRPKSLTHLSQPQAWEAILRTRTAVGQILLGRNAIAPLQVKLCVIASNGSHTEFGLTPAFIFPHEIERKPRFRFLDLQDYWKKHPEHAEPPQESRRQDGLYFIWDGDRIRSELLGDEKSHFDSEITKYKPFLYAFVPYQGSVWGEFNQILTGVNRRTHLYPGLLLAVNRQRLADIFDISATRYETFSRNVFVIVHFENARPDQGRKTVQDEVLDFAKTAANRAVQYLAKQRAFLRPAGEAPTPQQRQVERNHQDWEYNVRVHAEANPIHLPPVCYASVPLTEQDVIGLFHQFCALGAFPGIKIFATSQSKTYDCLVQFSCPVAAPGLQYRAPDEFPLGVVPFILGDHAKFETRQLTLEFKNNVDGLISDIEGTESGKSYGHIDVCVCWSQISDRFQGYDISEITEHNIEQREFPGTTHLLHRDGESHVIQVIMLKTVVDMVDTGKIVLGGEKPSLQGGKKGKASRKKRK